MLNGTTQRLLQLPKAELHVHLDGSLRPATLLELADERGVALPATSVEGVAREMVASDVQNLEEYLEPFRITLAVMQDAEALERISYELVQDHAAESVGYLEVRFCPGLHTDDGLTAAEALEAALRGLRRGEADFGVPCNTIVSALRTLPASASSEMAELAIAHRHKGVCAFDLAGAESGHPVRDHVDAFRRVAAAGLPTTIHAGEGFGPDSIRQALELGGAVRIGHGTRLGEDPGLLKTVLESGVTLEVCLTCNVQTRVVDEYAHHPVRGYFDRGVSVTLCTDNRLVSGVTLTGEYQHAQDDLGFVWDELVTIARSGFEHAFVSPEQRDELLGAFDRSMSGLH